MSICLSTLLLTIVNIYIVFFDEYKYKFKIFNFLKNDRNKNIVFLALTLLLFLFMAIFRDPYGSLSKDYLTYEEIFFLSDMPLFELYNKYITNDIGFLLLNKFFRLITDNFYIILAFFHGSIIFNLLYYFYRYSKNVWLSVLLLITIGSYYVSYNMIRQSIVIGFFLLSCKFLFNRNFIKYLIVILILTLFHKSIVVMIPIYFIMNINVFDKKNTVLVRLLLTILVLAFFNLEWILKIVQQFIYSGYIEGSFGVNRAPLFTLARPILVCIFMFSTKKYCSLDSSKNIIIFNASIIWVIISIFSYKMMILNRFMYYFIPFVLCYIPNVLEEIPRNKRRLYNVLLMLFVLAYAFVSQYSVTDRLFFPFY